MSFGSLGEEPLFAGKYRLVRALGKGAMGEVWLAEEEGPRNFRRRVAVKRLLAAGELGDVATESFVAEAQVIARLDHPNVVRLIELGSAEGGLYLVLDFVDGAALDRIYKRSAALSPAAVAYIGREVARALEAVHAMCDDDGRNYGVVHRDVTPSNILISRDGRVRLSDFGVARISGLGGEKTETGVFKGKLPYMPPEQARGEPFDGRADIFALGISLFEGLAGRRIRRAETQTQLLMMIATEPPPRVRELVPTCPDALAYAIDRATELNPYVRVADAGELASLLDDALRALGPTALKDAQAEVRARVLEVAGAPQPGTNAPSASRAEPQRPSEWSMQLGTGPSARTGSGRHQASAPPPPSMTPSSGSVPSGQGHSVTNVASSRDAGAPSSMQAARSKSVVVPAIVLVAFTVLGGVGAFFVLSRSASTTRGGNEHGATTQEATAKSAPQSVPTDQATAEPKIAADEPTAARSAPAPESGPSPVPKGPAGPPRQTTAAAPATASAAVETSTEPGTLVVTVLPWADVSVDGRSVGTTPLAPISLPPGPHTIVLRNSELGASRSTSVVVKPGKPSQVRIDLRRAD